jgi:hypothetical protein
MKRVVVRVYAGDAKVKGNPLVQAVGFLGSSMAAPGSTIADWTSGVSLAQAPGSTPTPGTVAPVPPITPGPVQPSPTPPATP